MAFNTAEGRAEYTASGGQVLFTFTFKIYTTADILVYLTPAGQTYDDTTDLLALTTDYTVVINGDNGGDLTLVAAASAGDRITIVRDLAIDRTTDYQTGGDLAADTLDADQDYQTYLVGDRKLQIDRCFQLPKSVQGVSTSVPTPDPGKLIGWNDAGDAIENKNIATPNSSFMYFYNYTATAAQDTFSAIYDSDGTSGIIISVNGIPLSDEDYTATTGTSIVLTSAATSGDQVDIWTFPRFYTANAVSLQHLDNYYTKTETDSVFVPQTREVNGKTLDANINLSSSDIAENIFIIRDEKTNGTAGGSSVASGSNQRELNTIVKNTITGASLVDSTTFELPAGNYEIRASAPGYGVGANKIWLFAASPLFTEFLIGENAYAAASNGCIAVLDDSFTIASTTQFILIHYTTNAVATNGLGVAVSAGASIPEVYASINIKKVG